MLCCLIAPCLELNTVPVTTILDVSEPSHWSLAEVPGSLYGEVPHSQFVFETAAMEGASVSCTRTERVTTADLFPDGSVAWYVSG